MPGKFVDIVIPGSASTPPPLDGLPMVPEKQCGEGGVLQSVEAASGKAVVPATTTTTTKTTTSSKRVTQLPTPEPSLPPSEDGDNKRRCLGPDSDDEHADNDDGGTVPEEEWLRIPDSLFYSIMSVEPAVNPNYGESKALSDPWVAK